MVKESDRDQTVVFFGVAFASGAEAQRAAYSGQVDQEARRFASSVGGRLVHSVLIALPGERRTPGRPTEFEQLLSELPRAELESEQIQAKLNNPLTAALAMINCPPVKQTRIINGLRARGGLSSIRDVLTVGKNRLMDMRNFGPTFANMVEEAVKAFVPEVPMANEMYAPDVARFCTELDQVPLAAVSIAYGEVLQSRRLTLAEVRTMDPAEVGFDPQGPSIIEQYVVEFDAERERLRPAQ